MIRTLSILGLLLAVVLPLVDVIVFRPRRAALPGAAPMRGAQRVIYLAFLLALAGMALSGIASLAFGERMHGWMLILHMTLAPLFSAAIAGLALMWVRQEEATDSSRCCCGTSAITFLVLASAFVTIITAMLGMMSWFGSAAQDVLLNVHRVASIAVTVLAAVQAARLLGARTSGNASHA